MTNKDFTAVNAGLRNLRDSGFWLLLLGKYSKSHIDINPTSEPHIVVPFESWEHLARLSASFSSPVAIDAYPPYFGIDINQTMKDVEEAGFLAKVPGAYFRQYPSDPSYDGPQIIICQSKWAYIVRLTNPEKYNLPTDKIVLEQYKENMASREGISEKPARPYAERKTYSLPKNDSLA